MAIFSFFKSQKPKSFNFKPRYYDAKKERLQEALKRNEEGKRSDPDAMKSRIQHGFKTKGVVSSNYESNLRKKSNRTLLIVLITLFLLSYLLLSRYSMDIVKFVQ